MWTLARPVRIEARLDWKAVTAWSMRRLRSAESPLRAGMPAMNRNAIAVRPRKAQNANGYSTTCAPAGPEF